MRKMKKINGYLVVRFNDREKREYEGTALGNFGVIDAELYTGVLDIDRDVMEYDGAETLEIAMEQARGLESELDVEEPETKITVIVEGETEISEGEVEPERLFRERKTLLETQLQSRRCADLDPRTATHELLGYAQALEDLGMIDGHDERYMVEQDIFGAMPPPQAPEWKEEALAYICDEICKHRIAGHTEEVLDMICERCKVGRWAADPPALTPQEVRELRSLWKLLKGVEDYINGGDTPDAELPQEVDLAPTGRLGEAKLGGDDPYKPWDKTTERIAQERGRRPYRHPPMSDLKALLERWQADNSAPYSALKACFSTFLAAEQKKIQQSTPAAAPPPRAGAHTPIVPDRGGNG